MPAQPAEVYWDSCPRSTPRNQIACLRCHAPRSEQQDAFLTSDPAEVRFLTGVDCVACHVRRHRRYSAAFKPINPHGQVTALPLFKESSFCSPCHQFPAWGKRVKGKLLKNTVQEWRASAYAREGVSCQDCHMPDGSHEFRGIHDPEMTRKAMQLNVRRKAKGIDIRARNVCAGHALLLGNSDCDPPRSSISFGRNARSLADCCRQLAAPRGPRSGSLSPIAFGCTTGRFQRLPATADRRTQDRSRRTPIVAHLHLSLLGFRYKEDPLLDPFTSDFSRLWQSSRCGHRSAYAAKRT
jgi:hypothetical protein